jgi:hypothetical protein
MATSPQEVEHISPRAVQVKSASERRPRPHIPEVTAVSSHGLVREPVPPVLPSSPVFSNVKPGEASTDAGRPAAVPPAARELLERLARELVNMGQNVGQREARDQIVEAPGADPGKVVAYSVQRSEILVSADSPPPIGGALLERLADEALAQGWPDDPLAPGLRSPAHSQEVIRAETRWPSGAQEEPMQAAGVEVPRRGTAPAADLAGPAVEPQVLAALADAETALSGTALAADPQVLAALVNEALIEQAQRHGVDLT